MLTGKFWITPQGVVDVSTSEHALYARNFVLGLLGTPREIRLDKHFLDPLAPEEARKHRRRGVPADVIKFLGSNGDARLYVIRERGWVRVRGNAFYLWRLDRPTLRLIRGAAEYWRAQRSRKPGDLADVYEMSRSDDPMLVRVTSLLDPRLDRA
jgi:hypothetical protein